eukprot:s391_g15.t1
MVIPMRSVLLSIKIPRSELWPLPFASMLADLNHEDYLLRPWYDKVPAEQPVLHVLWSRELVQHIASYAVEALRAAAHAGKTSRDAVSPFRILCVGSGASRLRHYLHFILHKVFRREDLRVAAMVPERFPKAETQRPQPARWPPLPSAEEEQFLPAEAGYTLSEALEVFSPKLVVCACMPPQVDWSRDFRRASSVLEYLLVGPAHSDRSGCLSHTWGGPEPFKSRGRVLEPPRFEAEGWARLELPELSAFVIGSDDAPGRVGSNRAVAFRRLLKPQLTFEEPSLSPKLAATDQEALPAFSKASRQTGTWNRKPSAAVSRASRHMGTASRTVKARLSVCTRDPRQATAALKRQHGEGVVAMLKTMGEEKLEPNVQHYNVSISTLGRSSHWQLSLHCFRVMEQRSIQKDTVTYNASMSACSSLPAPRLPGSRLTTGIRHETTQHIGLKDLREGAEPATAMGDRSRSRSRDGPKDVASAAKAGNSEQEIVAVAIKQLPTDIRERLEKLFEEGLLKEGDLDLRAITVFASLNENLQSRVLNHMETERIYVANARSKSGFLIATCDKAKTGCLDARGLGAIDPWRTALVAMATPKQRQIELKSEQDWLDQKGETPIKINVDVTVVESELGMNSVTVELPLTETCAAVKAKLVAMGVRSIPANRMMLHNEPVGFFLKEQLLFAKVECPASQACLASRCLEACLEKPQEWHLPCQEDQVCQAVAIRRWAVCLGCQEVCLEACREACREACQEECLECPLVHQVECRAGCPRWEECRACQECPACQECHPSSDEDVDGLQSDARARHHDRSWHFFTEMPKASILQDRYSYSSAMKVCSELQQWALVFSLLEDMKTRSILRDEVVYNTSISACEHERWELGLELFGEMAQRQLRRDAVSYNSVMSCCAKGAQWQLAAALFSEMEVQQIKKDAISFSSLISAAERGQHWAAALVALQQMFHAKVAEDVIVHNAAISACTIEILSSRLVLYINLCAQTAMAGRQLECRRMCGELVLTANPEQKFCDLLSALAKATGVQKSCLQLCRGSLVLDDRRRDVQDRPAGEVLEPETVELESTAIEGEQTEEGPNLAEPLEVVIVMRPPRHHMWPATDGWTGCGGNPFGLARCYGSLHFLAAADCRDCGARSHWRCCGCPDRNSEFCRPGTTCEQAKLNFDSCYAAYDAEMPPPKYVDAEIGEKCSEWQRALSLLAALPVRALAPDAVSFGATSAASARAAKWEISIGLFRCAVQMNLASDAQVQSTAIQACGRAQQWQRALEIFADGTGGRVAFNAILDAVETQENSRSLYRLALQRGGIYPGLLKDGHGTLDLHELSAGAASAAVQWWLEHLAPTICATRDVSRPGQPEHRRRRWATARRPAPPPRSEAAAAGTEKGRSCMPPKSQGSEPPAEQGASSPGGWKDREPPPPYDGRNPDKTFSKWLKEIKLWEYETEVPKSKWGAKLLRQLSGTARAAAEGLTFEEVACEKGMENVMKVLKEHFAPHLETSLPKAMEAAIYGEVRGARESFAEYVIRMEHAFKELDREGVVLPPIAAGYVFYRHANLTEVQDNQLITWCEGKYDKPTIIKNLRKLEKVVHEKRRGIFFGEENEEDPVPDDEAINEVYPADVNVEYESDEDDDYVYINAGELQEIYDEEQMQEALATYQEVRRSIREQRNVRGYYPVEKGKGKGFGGAPGKGKGKPTFAPRSKDKVRFNGSGRHGGASKIHIDQLKLRTRCARCGCIGHWAKECRGVPDARGRQNLESQRSSAAPTTSSTRSGFFVTGQSPGETASFFGRVIENEERPEHAVSYVPRFDQVMNAVCRRRSPSRTELAAYDQKGQPAESFVGVVTSSTQGVVDTAAQDGLIGKPAMLRQVDALRERGLRVRWNGKRAQATGVGGRATVIGVIEAPMGIAGVNGLLEMTMLVLKKYDAKASLYDLPSGHVAVDVMAFAPEGWSLPREAAAVKLSTEQFTLMNCSFVNQSMISLEGKEIRRTPDSSSHGTGTAPPDDGAEGVRCAASEGESERTPKDGSRDANSEGNATLEGGRRQAVQTDGVYRGLRKGRSMAARFLATAGANEKQLEYAMIIKYPERESHTMGHASVGWLPRNPEQGASYLTVFEDEGGMIMWSEETGKTKSLPDGKHKLIKASAEKLIQAWHTQEFGKVWEFVSPKYGLAESDNPVYEDHEVGLLWPMFPEMFWEVIRERSPEVVFLRPDKTSESLEMASQAAEWQDARGKPFVLLISADCVQDVSDLTRETRLNGRRELRVFSGGAAVMSNSGELMSRIEPSMLTFIGEALYECVDGFPQNPEALQGDCHILMFDGSVRRVVPKSVDGSVRRVVLSEVLVEEEPVADGEPPDPGALGRVAESADLKPTEEEVRLLKKVHENLGHPSNRDLARTLRIAHAKPHLVRFAAKEFSCPTCDARPQPKAARPAVLPKSYQPGQIIGIDVIHLPALSKQENFPALNIVDWGSGYSMVERIKDMSADHVWRTFMRTWVRTFGAPEVLIADLGTEFRGEFADLASQCGTLVRHIGARSPWQNGKTERAGAHYKHVLERARDTCVVSSWQELKTLMYEVESARNRFGNRSGFSPMQRQLGWSLRLPGSSLSDDYLDPQLVAQSAGDEVRRMRSFGKLRKRPTLSIAY